MNISFNEQTAVFFLWCRFSSALYQDRLGTNTRTFWSTSSTSSEILYGCFSFRRNHAGVTHGTPGLMWRLICGAQVVQMILVALFMRDLPDVRKQKQKR
jgi:hypothetical protein